MSSAIFERKIGAKMSGKIDVNAFYNIEYGLYIVTSNDGKKDNGCIVNAVNQVTNDPARIAVAINKKNYSCDIIKDTGIMNLCCLSKSAPFDVFKHFGFVSGRDTDKFADKEDKETERSQNGLIIVKEHTNAFMSLKTESIVDLGTHAMFICSVTEAEVVSDEESMTYSHYLCNVKPKPEEVSKKGFVCKVCGYVYESDTLPPDFICPLCKHGASDFEPIK